MRARATRAALGVAAVAAVAVAMAGGLAARRAAARGERTRVAALTRDAASYPERMRREQAELLAERDRLRDTLEEAEDLVRRDLRAGPEWADIARERTAQEELRRERDARKQEHHARYKITRLELDIQQLETELAELGGVLPPRPPGEDR